MTDLEDVSQIKALDKHNAALLERVNGMGTLRVSLEVRQSVSSIAASTTSWEADQHDDQLFLADYPDGICTYCTIAC